MNRKPRLIRLSEEISGGINSIVKPLEADGNEGIRFANHAGQINDFNERPFCLPGVGFHSIAFTSFRLFLPLP
jgi:hypothetical protein